MVSFCCCCCRLQVVPFLRGTAWEQPPPDLASFLYKNRIVYLGMCLVPSVTELMLAEFLYLQYDDAEKPIYLYINSTGTTKVWCCFWFTFPWFPCMTIITWLYQMSVDVDQSSQPKWKHTYLENSEHDEATSLNCAWVIWQTYGSKNLL